MIKATAHIETKMGGKDEDFTFPSPPKGVSFASKEYDAIVTMSIADVVGGLIFAAHKLGDFGEIYVTIRSSGDVWEKDEDEIII